MADAPPHAGCDTDLIVVGGGPAGCAAARMGADLGLRSILIEPDKLCRNLYRIPVLNNVLGGHVSGSELADVITAELTSTDLCRLELGSRVTELRVDDLRASVTLDSGGRLSAPYAVVATGVDPLRPRAVSWITAPDDLALPPIWRAGREAAEGRTLLVAGGDRPAGTFLRAHPTTNTRLLLVFAEPDAHKVEEIRDDPRVTLLPAEHLTLHGDESTITADVVTRNGERLTVTADAAYVNLGNAPAPPPGDLVRGADGYCSPADQRPRVAVAGDLRSPRFQRIMTALGSGSEAALRAYYLAAGVPSDRLTG
ncbi:FAD-dependent oxidoreductase [Amycolatopsis sp. NPDC004625]|uniref:FAD-dependent oxidoreductase n=1 Tax=Amycolatopsis sp. NPDC004625 TaxID=3154670 RepID=UPI0033A17DAE